MSLAQRAPFRVALAVLLAAAFAVLTVAPAHAAAYRFWGFYQLADGAWTFAQKGADETVPKDGTVEGWRFAVADTGDTRQPRTTLSFDQICGATPARSGNKRVGLVVDFGRPADGTDAAVTPPEPKAVCAVVPSAGTSTDVLRAAGELRIDKGLVCAVAGYPATGCGGEVKELSPEAKAADAPVQIAAATGSASGAAAGATTPAVAADNASAPAKDASSGASTAAYVIAGLALLAILAFVLVRSRAASSRRP